MALNRSDPETWLEIGRDPKLKHLAENPHFYDGDVHRDLELMRLCALHLRSTNAGVEFDLQFEDDGTMHLSVTSPGRPAAEVYILDGRYIVYRNVGAPDEELVESDTLDGVVQAL